jgi:hypothetical protein
LALRTFSSLNPVEVDDPALSGQAGVKTWRYLPIFSSFGQFGLYILTLEKQRLGTLPHQRLGKAE